MYISPAVEPVENSAVRPVALCVDLDGTLIRTDLLFESLCRLIKLHVRYLFLIPWWLLRGRAHLKQQIASHVDIDAKLLPYHQPFVHYLREQRHAGRRLVLATASNEKYATQIAQHLGIFDAVYASNAEVNLKAHRKRDLLVGEFGERGFDYAANSTADLPIWEAANAAILVDPDRGLRTRAAKVTAIDGVFDSPRAGARVVFKAIRAHHWIKNLLVFAPLLTSHTLTDWAALGSAVLAFAAFCLCASGIYVLNDIFDLESDRHHRSKRARPLASGQLSIQQGLLLCGLLLLGAFSTAVLLGHAFVLVLGGYAVTSLAYSVRLKGTPLLDVIVLAGLYTLRIFGGSAAIGVVSSFWLPAFAMFLFLSLAMVKRYAELVDAIDDGRPLKGRGYYQADLQILGSLGCAAGFVAVLVLALYINSDATVGYYEHPEILWLLCPILLYWIGRIWLIVHRARMHHDPLIWAATDHVSRWLGAIAVAIVLVAGFV